MKGLVIKNTGSWLEVKTDDGQTMGRWLVPFVRAEDKSNPEVVSDT